VRTRLSPGTFFDDRCFPGNDDFLLSVFVFKALEAALIFSNAHCSTFSTLALVIVEARLQIHGRGPCMCPERLSGKDMDLRSLQDCVGLFDCVVPKVSAGYRKV